MAAPVYGPSPTAPSRLTESQIVSDYHRTSLLRIATDSAEKNGYVVQRMIRFIRRHATSAPGSTETERAYNLYSHAWTALNAFDNGDPRALPNGAIGIPFSYTTGFTAHDASDDHNGKTYLIVDFICTGDQARRVIPMQPIGPYLNAPSRRDCLLDQTDLLPLFFVNMDRTVGVPILGPFDSIYPTKIFARSEKSSLKVCFNWPNIPTDEKFSKRQIQYRTKVDNKTPKRVTIPVQRMANLVANAVVNFMGDADKYLQGQSHIEHPRWRIGTGARQIKTRDVILMGIFFISPGAVMPVLRLRDGFP
ncbi:hypothetical protein K488DRAFT_90827 [Vararia minispora EC-137]|uniref:Uncharacterized protein n=1 Tax=Vararia minispora EC-137 TaxID=1314806 RepID=A0ACB8Q7F4_9AGAM|nr:hypothetical protein K488DRAFT_90827 [Vararia minispora EC-137]